MPLDKRGLTKVAEECGELTQIAMKKSAYMDSDIHPDGQGSLRLRLQDEIADVLAICEFVINEWGLDCSAIDLRKEAKRARFEKWHLDENS